MKPFFKSILEAELAKIEQNLKDSKDEECKGEQAQVDSDKIKVIVELVNEFNNILAKNFNVYGAYEDFSFATTRSADKMEQKLLEFFRTHFSGDFQLKNSFTQTSILPRIFYFEQKTKLIYSYNITNFMTQAIMIKNKFDIPEKTRYVMTPTGNVFMVGGFHA